uniref:Uncharacterized protein n=1 Tax=Alexandrium catenella TaxID=2925 RepID=A0A7S1LHS2_ALECA
MALKRPRAIACAFALVALALGLQAAQLLFTQAARPLRAPARAGRAASFESGKINVGVEGGDGDVQLPPDPVLSCDGSCVAAIETCLEEGCSVEALMKLDAKLAADEKHISATMEEMKAIRKMERVPEASTKIAWLENFLGRSGTLRGQLRALKPVEDSNFIQQMVKAAGVAFGGGRDTDYPKVGVSPYSS